MKLKDLESAAPKRELEQYVTSAHLASRMLYTAESQFGDLDDKHVLDLGCGCAVLSIGAVMLGAWLSLFWTGTRLRTIAMVELTLNFWDVCSDVLSVDIDSDALEIAKQNVEEIDMEDEIELVNARIGDIAEDSSIGEGLPSLEEYLANRDGERRFDTVVMNPPFGSWRKGIDMVFLESACELAKTAVYSLNKSSTRDYILKKAKTFGFEGTVIAEMKYDLPKTMAHHSKKSVDIQVDMWRFERISG
ncbi:BZ3500_MvSof-1268-A1-R1_Chr1-3g02248 [Microbotryum saponariae]|uniref:BZ3500_MvSof-1268-A1-R1_Chr1-3g02248 protein n=1 Tax=Microbotryum saponariae TaxID=289078 RepID=A0A2X0MGX5_9BASI|nr:BZ3500_MvSof-1268-A1-R1_Chr1-3g02248 [Microbotryum saponariae]SCZ95773.1 BZ3501_MvSof-1269-A2-R1_Chr1-3g01851 [Microbotryum saponariae]